MVLQFHAAFSIFLFLLFFFSVSISLKVHFIVLLTKGQADHLDFLILGDPGAVSRAGRKGALAEEPLGTDSHQTISKQSSKYWLLIGHKTALYHCAQSSNSISWVFFVSSYMTAIDSIMACLAHAPKKCTHSGNFYFDINSPFQNTVYPKLKTLFRKYKLELTMGIHACIDHIFVNIREFKMPQQLTATKTSHENIFSVSIVIIPTRLLY